MKTEKGYRNQVGTLTEQTSQTSSSSLTFPINKNHKIESFFFWLMLFVQLKETPDSPTVRSGIKQNQLIILIRIQVHMLPNIYIKLPLTVVLDRI